MKAGAREAWNEIQALWSVGFDVAAANDAVETEKDANNARRERTTGEAFAKRETDLAGRQAGREARLAGIGRTTWTRRGRSRPTGGRRPRNAQTELDYLISSATTPSRGPVAKPQLPGRQALSRGEAAGVRRG